jgi:hypothetical protein
MTTQVHVTPLEQHFAGQRVTVGVQPRAAHRDHDVTGTHAVGREHRVGLDDAHPGRGEVVVAFGHQAGMLGGLAAQERTTGLDAAVRDAFDQFGDNFGNNLADRDVILQKQRLGAADNEVVDHHGHQVTAQGVVLTHGLRDRDLRADTVGRRREYRFAIVTLELEESGKTTETAHDLRAQRAFGVRSKQFHGPLAGIDVHSRRSI